MSEGAAGLLLASTSPRRARLLSEAGIAFRAASPGVGDADEEELERDLCAQGLSPAAVVERLALAKLCAGLRLARAGERVLAADTTVAFGPRLLGKAKDERLARETLELLRGREHQVHSGVAIADARGRVRSGVATSTVVFREFTSDELTTFLASGVWRGKAGAYGVQDPEAAPLVEEVRGSRSNVIGLPLELVQELLAS